LIQPSILNSPLDTTIDLQEIFGFLQFMPF